MRDPSIHIRREDLIPLLIKYGVRKKNIDAFLQDARRSSCDNRSISISNEKQKKDVAKRLSSNKGDTSMMADILYSVRIQLKHKGVKKITQSQTRDWLQVKQLANSCNQFCEDFNLDTREGFITYVQLGIKRLQSLRQYISKLNNMYESICIEYESQKTLEKDPNPAATKKFHDLFINKVADRTGLFESYTNNIPKMLAFYKARLLADEYGLSYPIFIDAQFEALEWCSSMPSPEMLSGDKAKERLNKYMYEQGITTSGKEDEIKKSKSFWGNLKR